MKLRTKFLFSMAVMTAVMTAASLLIVRRSVDDHARQEILKSFQNSTFSVHDYLSRKDDILAGTADILSQTPILKAVMTTRDPLTIQDATASLWQTAHGDLLVLEDNAGQLMAVHSAGGQIAKGDVASYMRLARDGEFKWWLLGNRLYRVAIRNVVAGNVADGTRWGTLAFGYEVNTEVAAETGHIVDGNVAFQFQNRIVASTLSSERMRGLNQPAGDQGVRELTLSGERFLANVIEISASAGGPQLIMLQSYDQATSFVQRTNRLILVVGVIVILLSAGLAYLLSRNFTQPLHELLEGVRALAGGDFSLPLHAKGRDEVAELTSSFDRMRSSLQQSQERLVTSARMEAVGQLAGGIAHDFNNIITVIKGYAELLVAHIRAEDPLAKFANQISQAGDRASSLTRQLLAFSRKQKTERQPADIGLVARNLGKMLGVLVGERYKFTYSFDSKLVRVMADPSQIEQIILNLVVNARDAMPHGGTIEIRTQTAQVEESTAATYDSAPGRYARLSVIDTGTGMSADTMEKIFQPFFTTKEVGKGTGLGLSIVYAATQQSDGFVQVESELGKGSAFHIYLPELISGIVPVEVPKPKFADQCGSETILVVEDEEGIRNMVRDTLELRGYRVLLAEDGEVAEQMIKHHAGAIDLVLCDVVMPRLGGLDLLHRLSGQQSAVLLMSGYTDRINEIEDSAMPLLRKPFTPDVLALRIRELLSARKSAGKEACATAPR
jgi:signal transduction histidine kinase/ActR/RegA family two-component response regulator